MSRKDEEIISIPDQGARWWDVLRGEEASAIDKREFVGWVVQAPEHVEATLRMVRVHKALSRPGVRWPDTAAETLIREAKSASEEVVLPLPQRVVAIPEPRRRHTMSITL